VRTKPFFHSYSFRSGALIFLVFGITLVAVGLSNYAQSLRTAYADIRLIVTAHAEDLGESIERYGPAYANHLVMDIIRDADDENLFIALQSAGGVTGNFPYLPETLLDHPGWGETRLEPVGSTERKHLYTYSRQFGDGTVLLIGYGLGRVDAIRQSLPETLLRNVELAMVTALILSLLLVWLINRHVRKFNRAFDNVRQGSLGYRMAVGDEGDQFDRLAGNLNRMLDWLATMLSASRDLSNSLAHDMRTPLSRHRLELRAISEEPQLPAPLKERLDASVEQLDGLSNVFDDILTIAKAESRSLNELFDQIDLTELAGSIVEFCEPMLEEKNLQLQKVLPNESITMPGDRQLLGQAVLNLMDNAIKYTPEGGTVRIELERSGDEVVLRVADSGEGVPEDLLGKVTQRFFRANSSRNTPGSGLGLSLVEAVAKLHHGRLLLENTHPGFRATLSIGAI